jgi:galactokinase
MQTISVRSPGRINIIGEHTDYNDGFVLPAAIDKNTEFHLSLNGTEHQANIQASNLGEHLSFDLRKFERHPSGWENYIMGVVHELQELGANLRGFDGKFHGNIPIGGGLSSSAALECSLAFSLNELMGLGFGKWDLIKACQRAEHNFVGIKCGIMDPFASVMGKKDQLMLLDCRSLQYQYFPLKLGQYQILLLNTNVSHALASSEYNTRRAECEEGVERMREKFPEIKNLRDVTAEQLRVCKSFMPEVIYKRCRHVVTENERVLKATQILQSGAKNLKELGQLLYQSHQSLRHDYEVSCPELDFLVEKTLDKDFLLGGRMMGGGFGGCTINLITKEHKEAFLEEISASYRSRFGIDLTPYSVSIEEGTHQIEPD